MTQEKCEGSSTRRDTDAAPLVAGGGSPSWSGRGSRLLRADARQAVRQAQPRVLLRMAGRSARSARQGQLEQSGAARMIKRWMRRSLDMAFQGWADTTARRRKMRKSLTHCVNRLNRRGLTVSFDTWSERVADARRWRKTVNDAKKFLVGVFFRRTFAAFRGWKEHATVRRISLERPDERSVTSRWTSAFAARGTRG